MVCRFVQNKIFRTDKRPCQGYPPLCSAGERGESGIRFQLQMIDDGEHVTVTFPAVPLLPVFRSGMGGRQSLALCSKGFGHQRKNRSAPVLRHILGHLPDQGAGPDNDAGIRLPLPAQQGQQGRFSRAVGPHKSKQVPLGNVQCQIGDSLKFSVAFIQMINLKHCPAPPFLYKNTDIHRKSHCPLLQPSRNLSPRPPQWRSSDLPAWPPGH